MFTYLYHTESFNWCRHAGAAPRTHRAGWLHLSIALHPSQPIPETLKTR